MSVPRFTSELGVPRFTHDSTDQVDSRTEIDRKASDLTEVHSGNRDPLPCWQRMLFGRARRDDDTAWADEVGADPKEIPNVPGAPSHHRIKLIVRFSDNRFQPPSDEVGPTQGELTHRLRQERHPPLPGLDHRQPQLRFHQLERNARNTGARTGVKDVSGVGG